MLKAEAPPSALLGPAPPMRIDASDQLDQAAGPRAARDDEPVAQR
jgi:hypothetical protein